MKRNFYLVVVGFAFLIVGFGGCEKSVVTMAKVSLQPTATATPLCGFQILSLATLQYVTPTPMTGPTPMPVTTPVSFTGTTNVITSLAQWQAIYGTTTPPVDFNKQMILVGGLQNGCCFIETISDVCEDQSQITVSITRTKLMAQDCNMPEAQDIAVVVPKSAAPVLWEITSLMNAY